MRFLLTTSPDKASSAGTPPDPRLMEGVAKLSEEMIKAGVLVDTGGMSMNTARVQLANGKISVTEALKSIWPFYVASFVVVLLVVYVPALSLWLPALLK